MTQLCTDHPISSAEENTENGYKENDKIIDKSTDKTTQPL